LIDKETGIWDLKTALSRGGHKCDGLLAAGIDFLFSPQVTVDLGCGDGQYCKIFDCYGWPCVVGYEGTSDIDKIAVYKRIFDMDLSEDLQNQIKFDFVLCLEVGEHIPKERESVFIDNVCSFVDKDLVISWAVPGQGGRGHFNEQTNEYVIGQFESRGLVHHKETESRLREYASFSYFKNTLMVFGVKTT